jgi:signal peptidase II
VNVTHASKHGALGWLWAAAGVIGIDQLSKWAVVRNFELFEVTALLPVLDFTRLHNTGAAFSLLADASGWQRWFFMALALTVSIFITLWLRRIDPARQTLLPAGLALVMGGALGNVVDRIWHGHVIDFIHVHWQQHYFPAFNVADSAITLGAALLILDALLDGRRREGRA